MKHHRLPRLAADTLFALLLLSILLLAGWHAARHDRYWDWTGSRRNSLSPESTRVLAALEEPLRITVFAPPDHRLGRTVERLLALYRQAHPDLVVDFIDPQRFPERARDADVRLIGQLVVDYQGRREILSVLSEAALTNAIARLTTPVTPWVGVLEGHGERSVGGGAGPDIGRFAQLLRQRGFRLLPLDLARAPAIPANLDLLLLSTPSIALFPGEADALVEYLDGGGNLLWLLDPPLQDGGLLGLEPLAERLGLRMLPGRIVDAAAAEQGLDTPGFAVVERWPDHPLGRGLTGAAIFPGSLAFESDTRPAHGWRLITALTTGQASWNETGSVRGEVVRDRDAGEQPGPLAVALVLARHAPDGDRRPHDSDRQQRAIIVGDGDFLSNAYFGNGVNQALALRMARWLSGREDLVSLAHPAADTGALVLAPVRGWLIVALGLILLPVLLVAAGIAIRWHRGRA